MDSKNSVPSFAQKQHNKRKNKLEYKINEVYTFKLTSGEELVSKVLGVDADNNEVILFDPLSVAPGPQGIGLVVSMFTADPKTEVRLNTRSVTISALTDHSVKVKYIEATTGIVIPDKRLILG